MGAELRLRFPPGRMAQVLVAQVIPSPGVTLLAAPLFADGTVGPPVRMEATGRLHRAMLRTDHVPLVGALITGTREQAADPKTCRLANSFVIEEK